MNIIPLFEAAQTPMSQEDSEYFVQCLMLSKQLTNPDHFLEIENDIKTTLPGKIFYNRMEVMDVKCCPLAAAFILSLCNNPAKAVLWAFSLFCMQRMSKLERVTLDEIADEYFPNGFPNELEFQRIWTAQKQPADIARGITGNAIDNFDNWQAAYESAVKRRELFKQAQG